MTGNSDAACMKQTNASTLGISYELYIAIFVCLLSSAWCGRCYLLGCRAKLHSFGVSFSLHLVRMGLPSGKDTVTSCFINKTVQSASQMGKTPTIFLVKDGMMYPVFGKSSANCEIGSEAVADKLSTCPVSMPTKTFGVLVSGGTCGAVG